MISKWRRMRLFGCRLSALSPKKVESAECFLEVDGVRGAGTNWWGKRRWRTVSPVWCRHQLNMRLSRFLEIRRELLRPDWPVKKILLPLSTYFSCLSNGANSCFNLPVKKPNSGIQHYLAQCFQQSCLALASRQNWCSVGSSWKSRRSQNEAAWHGLGALGGVCSLRDITKGGFVLKRVELSEPTLLNMVQKDKRTQKLDFSHSWGIVQNRNFLLLYFCTVLVL